MRTALACAVAGLAIASARAGAAMTLLACTADAVFVATKDELVQRIGPP
ncbi:hypothetical protein [Paractinoplanes deccanensis]|nr:hypothetical protein [Actinoplanes deccanensis]